MLLTFWTWSSTASPASSAEALAPMSATWHHQLAIFSLAYFYQPSIADAIS